MNIKTPGLKYYVGKLNAGEKFSFVRYGNGEWDCIMKLYHTTRSGSQKFNPALRTALSSSLTVPREGEYYTAIQSVSFLERIGVLPKAEAWLSKKKINPLWHCGEVFTKASMKGRLYPIIEAMKKHKVVVVGPKWTMKLPFASVFIPITSRNCWSQVEEIKAQLIGMRNAVISFSAGPTTKVLIHQLYPLIGKSCWMIDFGSVWDPYCGVNSRRYHKRVSAGIQKRNLTGK